jgi:hypothetical protein
MEALYGKTTKKANIGVISIKITKALPEFG